MNKGDMKIRKLNSLKLQRKQDLSGLLSLRAARAILFWREIVFLKNIARILIKIKKKIYFSVRPNRWKYAYIIFFNLNFSGTRACAMPA